MLNVLYIILIHFFVNTMSDRQFTTSSDSDNTSSISCENVAHPNTDANKVDRTESRSDQRSTSATARKVAKPRRKRKPKYKITDEDSDDPEIDKDYEIGRQVITEDHTQRRSPRIILQVREAGAPRASDEQLGNQNPQQLPDEDVWRKLTQKKQYSAKVALAEINRKMSSVAWKPSSDSDSTSVESV